MAGAIVAYNPKTYELFADDTSATLTTITGVALGETNGQIAKRMGVDNSEVKNRTQRLQRRLWVRSRAALFPAAVRQGLMSIQQYAPGSVLPTIDQGSEMLELMADGLKAGEVGAAIGVSESAINSRVNTVGSALGATGRDVAVTAWTLTGGGVVSTS